MSGNMVPVSDLNVQVLEQIVQKAVHDEEWRKIFTDFIQKFVRAAWLKEMFPLARDMLKKYMTDEVMKTVLLSSADTRIGETDVLELIKPVIPLKVDTRLAIDPEVKKMFRDSIEAATRSSADNRVYEFINECVLKALDGDLKKGKHHSIIKKTVHGEFQTYASEHGGFFFGASQTDSQLEREMTKMAIALEQSYSCESEKSPPTSDLAEPGRKRPRESSDTVSQEPESMMSGAIVSGRDSLGIWYANFFKDNSPEDATGAFSFLRDMDEERRASLTRKINVSLSAECSEVRNMAINYEKRLAVTMVQDIADIFKHRHSNTDA